jgi:hypothetical protein
MGLKTPINDPITVTASSRNELEQKLEQAVSAAKSKSLALGMREGILVTRHTYNVFTVSLSDTVPFGTILEREDWRHSTRNG